MRKFIAFFEIPAADFSRAVDFYETVFDVKLPVFECEQEKMASFMEEGETVGGIFYAPEFPISEDGKPVHFQPSEYGVLIHFNCDDITETLRKVIEKGGKVIVPRTKIEADCKGWFAVFKDSEGNRIGIYADK